MVSHGVCTTGGNRQQRIDRRRSNTAPSAVFRMGLAFVCVGCVWVGPSSVLAAEENSNKKATQASRGETCNKAMDDMLLGDGSEDSRTLKTAIADHLLSFRESTFTDDNDETNNEWSLGFSDVAIADLRRHCNKYNQNKYLEHHKPGIYTMFLEPHENELTLACDYPSVGMIGRFVRFYGISACVAFATDDDDDDPNCQDMTLLEMARPYWESIGFERHSMTAADVVGKKDVEGGFLSSMARKCLSDTTSVLAMKHPELISAIEDFDKAIEVDAENASDMRLGFPQDQVDNLKSICSSVGGYFSIVEQAVMDCEMVPTTVVDDATTIQPKMTVTNVAVCLADTPECKNTDILYKLRDPFETLGVTCQARTELYDKGSSRTEHNEPERSPKNKTGDSSLFSAPSSNINININNNNNNNNNKSFPLIERTGANSTGLAIAIPLITLAILMAVIYYVVTLRVRARRRLANMNWETFDMDEIVFT